MSPGGHYGALMLSQDNHPGGGQSKVSVHPIASSLLFVTKLGGDTHKLSLSNVYVKHTLLSLPGSVTLRFHNDGNTHLIPRGVVTLSDASGRTINKGIINQDSDIILPQSYRRLYVPLQTIRPARSISRYRLTVDFRFDGYSQFRRYQTSFWVLPPGPLVILLAALAVIVILIVLGRKHWLVRAKTK